MALLRTQFDYFHQQKHKDFQWQDPTEDLFDSLINPECFNVPTAQIQRQSPNDFLDFFETHQAPSSNSESLALYGIPRQDFETWQHTALRFDNGDARTTLSHGPLASQFAMNGRAACSDTDLSAIPPGEVNTREACPALTPRTPRSRTKNYQPIDAPLSIRKRHSSVSPSKVDKQRSRSMRRFSPRKSSNGTALLSRRIQDAAAQQHFDLIIPSQYLAETPPSSAHLHSGHFDYDMNDNDDENYDDDNDDDQAVRSPSAFQEDYEASMSPLSNRHIYLLHQNTPMTSNMHNRSSTSAKSALISAAAEPHGHRWSSYSSSTPNRHSQSFSLTPPATGPMDAAHWTSEGPSPLINGHKAEHDWYSGVNHPEVTYGAPVLNLGLGLGLGISCADDLSSREFVMEDRPTDGQFVHDAVSPSSRLDAVMHASSPTPRLSRFSRRPMSSGFSASASSPIPGSYTDRISNGFSPLMHPISPVLDSHAHDTGNVSPSSAKPTMARMYTSSPAQLHIRPDYRPSHQRSHTLAAPLNLIPTSILAEPACASLSFSPPLPSPSSPTLPKRTTRNCTPANPSLSHRRSKSVHNLKRLSMMTGNTPEKLKQPSSTSTAKGSARGHRHSSSANMGFVNFTPHDSRKILTGVAPSGSSKTKARREKEAADKRRKLSEAAKRVVLEAGGDLEALEREVLALTE